MKMYFNIVLCFMLIAACSNPGEKNNGENKITSPADDPAYQTGLNLVAKYKCLTCHTIDRNLTGPAYRAVADKYDNYPDTIVTHLANKIIRGGKGVWGEIYMTPNSAVTIEEAEAMVKYILLLKTN